MYLLWGADLRMRPSWQMSTVQDPRKTWLATGRLLTVWWRMQSLGPRLQQTLAFRLWLLPAGSGCCLPASSRGTGLCAAGQLSFGISSVLCSVSRPGCALESFAGKFCFFLFVCFWRSHSLGCYLTLGPSDCPQSIQAQSLP